MRRRSRWAVSVLVPACLLFVLAILPLSALLEERRPREGRSQRPGKTYEPVNKRRSPESCWKCDPVHWFMLPPRFGVCHSLGYVSRLAERNGKTGISTHRPLYGFSLFLYCREMGRRIYFGVSLGRR